MFSLIAETPSTGKCKLRADEILRSPSRRSWSRPGCAARWRRRRRTDSSRSCASAAPAKPPQPSMNSRRTLRRRTASISSLPRLSRMRSIGRPPHDLQVAGGRPATANRCHERGVGDQPLRRFIEAEVQAGLGLARLLQESRAERGLARARWPQQQRRGVGDQAAAVMVSSCSTPVEILSILPAPVLRRKRDSGRGCTTRPSSVI